MSWSTSWAPSWCLAAVVLYLHIICHKVSCLEELALAGVVHRDIKPSNVLLALPDDASQAQTVRLVLMDFGVALEKDKDDSGGINSPFSSPKVLAGGGQDTCVIFLISRTLI